MKVQQEGLLCTPYETIASRRSTTRLSSSFSARRCLFFSSSSCSFVFYLVRLLFLYTLLRLLFFLNRLCRTQITESKKAVGPQKRGVLFPQVQLQVYTLRDGYGSDEDDLRATYRKREKAKDERSKYIRSLDFHRYHLPEFLGPTKLLNSPSSSFGSDVFVESNSFLFFRSVR